MNPNNWEKIFDKLLFQSSKRPETHFGRLGGGYNQALFDHERKIIFIHTTKCGCTTVKNIFYEHMGVELPEDKFHVHHPSFLKNASGNYKIEKGVNFDEYVKFQFYRDPFQRAACCFSWNQEHQKIGGHPVLADNNPKAIQKDGYMAVPCEFKCNSIHEFLEGLINNKVWKCWQCRVHTIKQFVETKIDEKINIANLDQELERLNKKYDLNLKNMSVEQHSLRKMGYKYDDYLDEKAIDLVKRAYPEDVEFFGENNEI